jgi:hypothetical protein
VVAGYDPKRKVQGNDSGDTTWDESDEAYALMIAGICADVLGERRVRERMAAGEHGLGPFPKDGSREDQEAYIVGLGEWKAIERHRELAKCNPICIKLREHGRPFLPMVSVRSLGNGIAEGECMLFRWEDLGREAYPVVRAGVVMGEEPVKGYFSRGLCVRMAMLHAYRAAAAQQIVPRMVPKGYIEVLKRRDGFQLEVDGVKFDENGDAVQGPFGLIEL